MTSGMFGGDTGVVLVLASRSASRRAMLEAAGIAFEIVPADIDERALEAGLSDATSVEIAEALSVAKAAAVAAGQSDALVLGSDSLVTVAGHRFDKPGSQDEAREHLHHFSGRTIELTSGAALVRGNTCEWSGSATARLAVRELSEDFIARYLACEWPAIRDTVGCFRIEGPGVQLFERIEGDQFTILGMPLIPVLAALREAGALAA